MRLRALIMVIWLSVAASSLVARSAEGRARAPMRKKVVKITTGNSTTYVTTKRYKKAHAGGKKSKITRHGKRAKRHR